MANEISNTFKAMALKGQIAALSDTFKVILMKSGFVFVNSSHHAYADVSASELPTANGYTAGGITLTDVFVTVDETSGKARLQWSNAQVNASGGSLIVDGAIIIDDSTNTGGGDDYTDAIVAYIDPPALVTATDGTPVIVQNLYIDLN
jgi:hypothetical protein